MAYPGREGLAFPLGVVEDSAAIPDIDVHPRPTLWWAVFEIVDGLQGRPPLPEVQSVGRRPAGVSFPVLAHLFFQTELQQE